MKVLVDTVNQRISHFRKEQICEGKQFPNSYVVLYVFFKHVDWVGLADKFGDVFFGDLEFGYDDYGCIVHHIAVIKDDETFYYAVKV